MDRVKRRRVASCQINVTRYNPFLVFQMSKEKVIYVSQKVLEITYFAFRQADYD